MFQEVTFRAELSSLRLKKNILGLNLQGLKTKKKLYNFSKITVKEKYFLYFFL